MIILIILFITSNDSESVLNELLLTYFWVENEDISNNMFSKNHYI